MAPPMRLSVERYAEVLAFVVHYRLEPLEETLAAAGLSLDDWIAAEAFWTGELSLYEKRGQGLLSMRFASAYGKMRRRLARYGTSARDAMARASDVVPEHPRSPALGPEPGRPAATPQGARDPREAAPALPSFALAQQQAQPAAAYPQPSAPPAAPPPAPAPPLHRPNAPAPTPPGTFFLPDGGSPASRAMPFQVADPAAPPPSAPQTGPALAKGGTTFAPDGAPPPKSLPFQAQLDPSPPQGELPALPALSLEHYVALLVELAGKPDRAEEILRRYRISGVDEKQRIDAAFRAHFRVNGQLRQRYEMLVQRFSAFSRA